MNYRHECQAEWPVVLPVDSNIFAGPRLWGYLHPSMRIADSVAANG